MPETKTEVVAVAAAVETRMKRVLVGREADEKTFKTLAPYATIHLATHGVLDNGDPLNSYVLLTKTEDETENDGLLHAHEIIDAFGCRFGGPLSVRNWRWQDQSR